MNHCIVILSFNHPELTAKAVQSALKFNVPTILIHNGSLEKNIQRLKSEFNTITHFEITHNEGWTKGVNEGLKFAFNNFDWVFFITNDTEIISMGEFPENTSSFVAPLIYFRKISRIDSMGGVFRPSRGHLRHIKDESSAKINSGEYFYVPGTAFIIHRELFFRVGGFDESLHTYWEDVDFSVRAHLKGENLIYNGSFSLLHKVGKTCHKDPFYTTFLYKRNRKKISLRYSSFLSKMELYGVLFIDFFKVALKLIKRKDWARLKLFLKAA